MRVTTGWKSALPRWRHLDNSASPCDSTFVPPWGTRRGRTKPRTVLLTRGGFANGQGERSSVVPPPPCLHDRKTSRDPHRTNSPWRSGTRIPPSTGVRVGQTGPPTQGVSARGDGRAGGDDVLRVVNWPGLLGAGGADDRVFSGADRSTAADPRSASKAASGPAPARPSTGSAVVELETHRFPGVRSH